MRSQNTVRPSQQLSNIAPLHWSSQVTKSIKSTYCCQIPKPSGHLLLNDYRRVRHWQLKLRRKNWQYIYTFIIRVHGTSNYVIQLSVAVCCFSGARTQRSAGEAAGRQDDQPPPGHHPRQTRQEVPLQESPRYCSLVMMVLSHTRHLPPLSRWTCYADWYPDTF